MSFHNPELLWLLLLLPLLALWRGMRGQRAAIEYSSADLVREVARASRFRAGRWLGTLRLLAVGLLILALARPQFGRGMTEVEASGIDIVLAIDVSGSMEALDFEMNGQPHSRIDVVKAVVAKFIEARPNDRIGIVAFAGRPYMVSPLTLDHSWLLQNLERVRIGLVEDGTAIGSGIAASVNRLRDQPSKSKIIVLLTDGVNNSGKVAPVAAADAARALGIKVYTIGAGAEGEAPMPLKDQFGNKHYQMQQVDVDEETLKKVAEATDAKFFRATDTASLEDIYGLIDKMEKTEVKVKKFQKYQELFAWFLIPGLALLGAEFWFANTRYRRLP
jgi:Ca-activated chloride channel family protein